MSKISVRMASIINLDCECIVNAANKHLKHDSSVSGIIFDEAGHDKLTAACEKIGFCEVGSAVITPGFKLRAKYIIHAVGPRWKGGKSGEPQELSSCYKKSLELAMEKGCHSIGFPLISSGIYGYPMEKAWKRAIIGCKAFMDEHPDYDMDITFAVLNSDFMAAGEKEIEKIDSAPAAEEVAKPVKAEKKAEKASGETVYFARSDAEIGAFSPMENTVFTVEGITYQSAQQYLQAKKALLFLDFTMYMEIIGETSAKKCKNLGKEVRHFDSMKWDAAKEEIAYHGNLAKFGQNEVLKKKLLATGDAELVYVSAKDDIWGTGMNADNPLLKTGAWEGQNVLGKVLMRVRETLAK